MPKKKNENNEDLDEKLVSCLKDLLNEAETEDSWVRKQQIKLWKKNDEFWHGIQFIFWSESRQEWISPTETRWFQQEEGREEAEGPFYDYVVNIYKAHGESIIAALSAQTPGVRFPPDDAEDADDILTSRTYAKIADLVQRHNKAKLSLMRALFILWNQGVVFAYRASKQDKAYGMIQIPKHETSKYCEECDKSAGEEDDNEENAPDSQTQSNPTTECPTCGGPLIDKGLVTGFTDAPKSRVVWDLLGGLHVRVPYYARNQKECRYLIWCLDVHKSILKSIYPHIADKIEADYTEMGAYERVARTPSSFSSFSRVDENRNLATHRRIWFRPTVFEGLGKDKEEEKKKLQKLFPDGCYVAFVGQVYAESRNEDLDKHWEIGQAGLSQYIHSDPLGQPLISIQELQNVLVNLTQETIEHGIPSGFADSEVLNMEVYSRHEARPGFIYSVKPKPGESIKNAFYEMPRATLSKEVPAFSAKLEQMGQFVVGSFPSIYGGPAEGKSRTAAEYNMSRQMALQRLSITWSFLVEWWARLVEGSVHMYIEHMIADERHTVREDGNYVNVWVRQAEMSGRVGQVEAEASETFPISMPQKQELLLRLLNMNNEFLQAAIFDPNNRTQIADILSFPGLYIPGEDQRIKQAREIQTMLKGQQVLPEPLVDDDAIHISVCKAFLVGESGLDAKQSNPEGYQLIVEHLTIHQMSLQGKTAAPFEDSAPGNPPQQGVQD